RKRVWASPPTLPFTGFWLVACGAAGFVTALVTLVASRDLADAIAYGILGFIIANLSALMAVPVMILYAIHSAIWRSRDAAAFAAWGSSLPFPCERFVETLSLDHSLSDMRVVVRFVRDAPDATVLDGLVGNLAKADGVKVV